MEQKHTVKQMLLRTEQEPEYTKHISNVKEELMFAIRSGSEENIKKVMEKILKMQVGYAVNGDLNITKLYLASYFSELIEEAKKAGLPGNIAMVLKDDTFQKIASAVSKEEMDTLSTEFYKSLFRMYKNYSVEHYSMPIRLAIERINDLKMQKISTTSIAALLNIDRSYLSKAFHKETGMTMHDYIVKVKMETACKLITERNFSLIEIASLLGYENYSAFSRAFKKYNGVLPGEFR